LSLSEGEEQVANIGYAIVIIYPLLCCCGACCSVFGGGKETGAMAGLGIMALCPRFLWLIMGIIMLVKLGDMRESAEAN